MADRQRHPHALRPPSLALLALELRAPWEFGSVLAAWPVLRRARAGDGHGVIVFPGLGANDATTAPLRRYLGSLRYATQGWNQGFNWGPRAGVLQVAQCQLADTFERSQRKVSLVGWSLGGVYARELAKQMPDKVRCVITLGAPFAGPPQSTRAWRLYEWASGHNPQQEAEQYDLPAAPPVPTTSIYSRSDGMVAWQGSLQAPSADNPQTENVEVVASHFGMGLNPSAWWVVADRLAQPEGHWRAFDRHGLHGLKGLIFPDPARA